MNDATERATIIAFMAPVGGTGRTGTVANLAWVLAGAGKRVLVLDWGSESPRIPEHLDPFLLAEPARLLAGVATAMSGLFPAIGELPEVRRYRLPDTDGRIDVFQPIAPGGEHLLLPSAEPDSPSLAGLRAQLAGSGYHYVLVDAPTGDGPEVLSLVGEVAGVAVICFKPHSNAITQAADLTGRLLGRTPLHLDLVPVVTMFDQGNGLMAEESLKAARTAFAGFRDGPLAREDGAEIIHIPYLPYETFRPLLAVLVERPDGPAGVHEQYGRLAAAITRGEVSAVAPVPRPVLQRYRRAFKLDPPGEPDRVLVAYATPDRNWADWVCTVLGTAGVRATLLRAGADRPADGETAELAVISSPDFTGSDEEKRATEEVAAHGERWDAVRIVVAEGAGATPGITRTIDLTGYDDAQARAGLLTRLGLVRAVRAGEPGGRRLPGRRAGVFRLPPRNVQFVGRDEDLEDLRDRVLELGPGQVITVTGAPGVGKSELVLEYAHRFAGDYDLVWWTPAHDEGSLLLSLAQLNERMRTEQLLSMRKSDLGAAPPLEELAAGLARNWLVVLDNVDDRTVLAGQLPAAGHRGHVLVTSSDERDSTVELSVMQPPDSAALVSRRVPELSAEDAEQVAAAVDHLPLALQLASAWLVEAVAAERRAGSAPRDVGRWAARAFLEGLARETRAGVETVARVVPLLVDSLKAEDAGSVAVVIAQLCSFLSTQGVDLGLVRSPAMIARLATICDRPELRTDAVEMDRMLAAGARYGLYQLDWGRGSSLRLHRVVQEALLRCLSEEDRLARQADVLDVLAAYAPTEVEENTPGARSRLGELQKHVYPSGALGCERTQVRRWLVNQVRFLYTEGIAGLTLSLDSTEPAHVMLTKWTDQYGPDDPLTARLAIQLANLERLLGHPIVALRLDEEALARQLRRLPPDHPQALAAARGRAADLRGLGRFTEALLEDQATWEGLTYSLGADHPQTRSAANNLANSLLLSGDAAGALEREADNYRRRRHLLGVENTDTWWSLAKVGVYQRELGDYQDALRSLKESGGRLRELAEDRSPARLLVRWHTAITERLLGAAERSAGRLRGALDHNNHALRGYRTLLGPDHPDTLACMLSSALNHRLLGDAALAVNTSRQVLAGLTGRVGLDEGHPFVALTRSCLGLSLAATGEHAEAAAEADLALDSLDARLGPGHPWTLATRVNEAGIVAGGGDPDRARELVGGAHRDCREYLGARHPHTRTAAHDLTVLSGKESAPDDGWRDIDVDIPQT